MDLWYSVAKEVRMYGMIICINKNVHNNIAVLLNKWTTNIHISVGNGDKKL